MDTGAQGPLNVRWGAVALGALFALGAQVLASRIEASLWGEPDSAGALSFVVMLASLLVPLLGALVAVRAAALANVRGAYLHGLAAFCLYLVASALLLPAPWLGAAWRAGFGGARGVGPLLATLAALLGLAGAFVGSAVARRQVLGQPAFRRSDFVPGRRGFGLEALRRRKARAGQRSVEVPRERGDEPREPIH